MVGEYSLQTYVEAVSLTYFDREFKHKAVWNNRLRSTGGRYHLKDHHLDFNRKIFLTYGEEVFLGIVKHELCHYHLSLAGRGFHHRDADFKVLLAAVGGSRFAPALKDNQPKYTYRCQSCHQLYYRRRRMDIKHYACGKCRGKLQLLV